MAFFFFKTESGIRGLDVSQFGEPKVSGLVNTQIIVKCKQLLGTGIGVFRIYISCESRHFVRLVCVYV